MRELFEGNIPLSLAMTNRSQQNAGSVRFFYTLVRLQMKFVDSAVNVAKRFSIGREMDSGRHYLSIPVANRMVDYEEYYEISAELHDGYPANEARLSSFASECREQKHDLLLLQKPGSDRGVAT